MNLYYGWTRFVTFFILPVFITKVHTHSEKFFSITYASNPNKEKKCERHTLGPRLGVIDKYIITMTYATVSLLA